MSPAVAAPEDAVAAELAAAALASFAVATAVALLSPASVAEPSAAPAAKSDYEPNARSAPMSCRKSQSHLDARAALLESRLLS